MVIEVLDAKYVEGYKIAFEFSDGVRQIIDFEDFLTSAKNPTTKKYLNLSEFKNFNIAFGDVIWNDYEMCFPTWDLHEGKI